MVQNCQDRKVAHFPKVERYVDSPNQGFTLNCEDRKVAHFLKAERSARIINMLFLSTVAAHLSSLIHGS
jgi:hypothetical protein